MTRMAGTSSGLSAEDIRSRFGLSYNEEHAGGKADHQNGSNNKTGALYNSKTGEYIGTVNNFARNDEGRKSQDGDGYLREDDGVMGLKSMEEYARKNGLLSDEITNWNSINDVASMANQILGSTPKETSTEPKPITYSDKTAKAKAGVAAYENVILPYQGDYITGEKETNPADDYFNEYKLQLDKYRRPRDPNQIDGPAYDPSREEAAVAGFDTEF